ncbi:hypothetical protein PV773_18170 [Mesorhizobium sp. CC13]|uniref:recombinase zinc beta ribbon domain-containing protein n=1 Tax=Mesorhizobium sp. CC13 TaxID=3029194 RepID=UPI0032679170
MLSGLVYCRCCGGPYSPRSVDRFACSSHISNCSCPNRRTIARSELAACACRSQAPDDGAGGGRGCDAHLCRGDKSAQPRAPRQCRRLEGGTGGRSRSRSAASSRRSRPACSTTA